MNVLLVRPDGIGDEILCLPVATELKRLVPGARVAFLSSLYAAPVLEHHPDIDEIITVTRKETLGESVRLFRKGFDAAVFMKPFRDLIAAAWAARVPRLVGTGYRWYSFLLNRRVYQHRKEFARHEIDYNVELLKGLGVVPGPARPPRLFLTEAETAWARSFLGEKRAARVIVHAGGFSSRHWGARRFADLARHLDGRGHGVFVTGGGAERELFASGAGALPAGIRNLMGQFTMRQLMAVIGGADLVVSLATGPAHIAAGMGVRTVSIFDPRRSNSPTRWKPLGDGVILMPAVPTCERCTGEKCPVWDCMERITPDAVAEHVDAVLAAPKPVEVVCI